MRKIVLVSPPGSTAERLYSMVEIGGVKAILKKNHYQINVIDGINFLSNVKSLADILIHENPIFIGMVFQWGHQPFLEWSKLLLQYLKEKSKTMYISALGRGASNYYEDVLTLLDKIDSIILGESEKTIVELLGKVLSDVDWTTQKGIAFRDKNRVVRNPLQDAILDLDSLPFPDRDYLSNRRLYPIAPLYTSRYCYGKCNFCANLNFWKMTPCNVYRARSPGLVVEELNRVKSDFGVKTFYFVEDNFFVDGDKGKDRAVQIAEGILNANLSIRYHVESRVNDVDRNLFALLKKSGLRKVFLGIESGSQSVLDRYNKGTDVENNRKAIQILKDLEINWEPGFIMFDPWTTLNEMKDNYRFITETALHRCKGGTGNKIFNPLTLYRSSKISDLIPQEAIRKDIFSNNEIHYTILDPKVKTIRELLELYERIFYQQEVYYNQIFYKMLSTNTRNAINTGSPVIVDKAMIKVFQKQYVKWIENKSDLDIQVLGRLIESAEVNQMLDRELSQHLTDTLQFLINEYHKMYFGNTFTENQKKFYFMDN